MKKIVETIIGIIWVILFLIQLSCVISLFKPTFGLEHLDIITTFVICEVVCFAISKNFDGIAPGLLMFSLDFYYRERKNNENNK